ncbi:hypothetical protein MMC30_006346 [Trapelia coarctata]|nr:hypothetical protein [Trapelia coarctata]
MLLVSGRLYVRISMKNLGPDDYCMVVALILYVIGVSLSTVDVANGSTRHIYYLNHDQIKSVLRYMWIVQPFGIMASAFGKTSVAFLTLRLMGPHVVWRKWILYTNMVLYMLGSIVSCVITLVQCSPVQALWETGRGSHCWDPKIAADVGIFLTAYSAFIDFSLALIPVTILWSLKVSPKKKLGLSLLLSLGVLAGITAVMKALQIPAYVDPVDITWTTFGFFAWASTEISLLIICGCVPAIKPLYDRVKNGKPLLPVNSPYRIKRSYHKSTNHGQLQDFALLTPVNHSTPSTHTTEHTSRSTGDDDV